MSVTINDFVASGASHASGVVPDPGATAGTSRFLREDATWSSLFGENFFTDIGPQCAVLTGPYPNGIVQLSAGGNAVLSVPAGASVDGKCFTLKMYSKVSKTASPSMTCQLFVNGNAYGLAFTPGALGSAQPGPISGVLALQLNGFWDSTNGVLFGSLQWSYYAPSGGMQTGSGTNINMTGVSSMADLQFTLQWTDSVSADTSTVTTTQFSLALD